MMRQLFDSHLKELREAIIRMGTMVQEATRDAVKSLKDGDEKLARQVIDGDEEMNRMEDKINEIGIALIATQQPVAKDLRRIIIAFRMASDMERMGDLAVDIAQITLHTSREGLLKPLVDIPRMAEIVQDMINDSIRAYVDENVELAYKMARMDDEVDQLHGQILREMFSYIVENPRSVNQALQLCFVSRYLERMADHATNIGESVVYLVQGKRPDLN